MILLSSPPAVSFAGNPVRFVFETQETFLSCEFRVYVRDNLFRFSGQASATRRVSFDIAEILQSFASPVDVSASASISFPIPGAMLPYSVEYWDYDSVEGKSDTHTLEFHALPGGIGSKMIRALSALQEDMFSYRLKNYARQFLFTTRTNARLIAIKETELSPLYYLAPDLPISIVNEYGRELSIAPDPSSTGQLCALNLPAIRKYYYDQYNTISSYFSVLVDHDYVFEIAILPGAVVKNRFVIRFRNALGCFENIEVTGKCKAEPEFGEDSPYLLYDDLISRFIEQNDRVEIREIILAEIGYKTTEEYLFLRDMLQSDKRYLVDAHGASQEVRVTCEEFSHDLYPLEPGSVSLTIRYVDSDTLYTPEIDLSAPGETLGGGIWDTGVTRAAGFLYEQSILKTI